MTTGTVPNPAVNTYPYCGACGYDVARYNVTDGNLCDSCGSDLTAFGLEFAALGVPGVAPTGGQWDGWAPKDITVAIADAVANPATLWTTGQFIFTGEGDAIYWDSATWQPGIAA
jgi:hypothetical protein